MRSTTSTGPVGRDDITGEESDCGLKVVKTKVLNLKLCTKGFYSVPNVGWRLPRAKPQSHVPLISGPRPYIVTNSYSRKMRKEWRGSGALK